MWSNWVTDKIAGTTLITKNGPNGETRNLLGCWATYANNYYIPNIDDADIVVTGNVIRVDQIPLTDMFHNTNSLQESFDYKPMYCYSNYVPSLRLVPGQPDELEKLSICGVCISAEDPSIVTMHAAFSVQASPGNNARNQENCAIKNFMKSRKSRHYIGNRTSED